MRILVVEDNPADRRLIEIVLGEKQPGWTIAGCATLAEALALAPFSGFSCLLVDLGLPDAQGLEAIVSLRAHGPHTALVVLTSLDDDGKAREAIRNGAQDYVVKSESGLAMLSRSVEHAVERHKTQRALEMSRRTTQALLDGSHDDIALLDRDGTILALNAHAAKTLVCPVGDAVGGAWLTLCDPVLVPVRRKNLDQVFATGRAARFEENDGRRWYRHHLQPVPGQSRDESFVASFAHDITDEKAAVAALAEVKLDAEQANRAKTEFMSRMSREIRTPLNDVIGFSEMMVSRMLGPIQPEPYGEYVEAVHNSGRNILKLIDHITDVSMLESALKRDESSYRDLVELSPDLICVCVDGEIELMNAAGTGMLRAPSSDVFVGRAFTDLVHPDYLGIFEDLTILFDERRPVPVKLLTQGGRFRDVEISAVPLKREGRIKAALLVGRDITDVTAAMTAVVAREHRLRAIMDTVMDGIVTVNQEGRIETANLSVERIFGYSPSQLVGYNLSVVLPDAAAGDVRKNDLVRLLAHGREMTGRRKDGTLFPVNLGVSELQIDGEHMFTATIRDLTEHKQLTDKVAYLSHHDPLTDLPNRLLWSSRLEDAVVAARASNRLVAVLTIDLAGFTTINDSLGHDVGNLVLRETANRLRTALLPTGTAARLSADEFAAVLPELDSVEDVHKAVDRLREVLSKPYAMASIEMQVLADIGVSVYPRDGETASDLFRNAETALHTVKRSEKRLGFFDAHMTTEAAERLALERSIRRAIDQDQFEIFYQPQVALKTGLIVGGEALIRWRHPDLGLVVPDKFIPAAEATGLIVPIGEWVLRGVCKQIKAWENRGMPRLRLGVNISGRQFREPNLAKTVHHALSESGVNPSMIELELTESMLMSDGEETLRLLNELSGLGVKLSIDDFGTGYSSLSYLKRFPVNTVKIDRTFVKDLEDDEEDRVIANAIISLAHSLALTTIAEGVENEAQAAFLKASGCDEIQGYWIGKPVPAREFEAMVMNHQAVIMTGYEAKAG